MTPAEVLAAIAREKLQLVTVPGGGFIVRDSSGRVLQYPDGRGSELDVSVAVEDALRERDRRADLVEERKATSLLRELDNGSHPRPRRITETGGSRIVWELYDANGNSIDSEQHGSAIEALLSLKSRR